MAFKIDSFIKFGSFSFKLNNGDKYSYYLHNLFILLSITNNRYSRFIEFEFVIIY